MALSMLGLGKRERDKCLGGMWNLGGCHERRGCDGGVANCLLGVKALMLAAPHAVSSRAQLHVIRPCPSINGRQLGIIRARLAGPVGFRPRHCICSCERLKPSLLFRLLQRMFERLHLGYGRSCRWRKLNILDSLLDGRKKALSKKVDISRDCGKEYDEVRADTEFILLQTLYISLRHSVFPSASFASLSHWCACHSIHRLIYSFVGPTAVEVPVSPDPY